MKRTRSIQMLTAVAVIACFAGTPLLAQVSEARLKEGTIDLLTLLNTQQTLFQAQDALTSFLLGAHARGYRAVLVVTGKGSRGGTGIIRASVAEWVAQPPLRAIVAGVSPAHRRHGGEGAVYVTLRR